MLDLRIKNKNKEWYKDVANYYMPAYSKVNIEDYDEMKKLYEFMNNDLSGFQDEINTICNDIYTQDAAIEELIPYNKVKNKIDVLIGDLIRRKANHKLILMSAKAIRSKNDKLKQLILENVEKELAFEIQKSMAELEGLSEEEMNKFIEETKNYITPTDLNYKNFLTDTEIYKYKMLQYTMYNQDIKYKSIDSFKHLCISDRMFVHNGWKHGKPYIKVLNPLFCGFHKSPELPFVQHGDYFWVMDEMSIGQALDEYGNILTEEEIEKIRKYSNFYNASNKDDLFVFDHTRQHALLEGVGVYDSRNVGSHQGTGTTKISRYDKVTRVHLEFKAYEEVMFYTYEDEYGEPITVVLDKNTNIIPSNAAKVEFTNRYFDKDYKWVWSDDFGKHEVETLYVPRRYEIVRLGYDIYPIMRKVPFQPEYLDPFSKFELSFKGGIFNSMNAKSVSLVQLALPYQFQIYALKLLQNKEISTYQGINIVKDVDRIPDALSQDETGNPIEGIDKITQSEIIRRKTKTILYSDSQQSLGLPPSPTRGRAVEVLQLGNMADIINSQQLIELIDKELGIAMGVNAQREAQVASNTNVTDNQQALIQSALTTDYLYYWHNKIWSHVLNEHLTNMDIFFKRMFDENKNLSEHLFEYVLPDNSKELIKVTPDNLNHNDIGIFLSDTDQDKLYIDFMIQNLQPIAQNAGQGSETVSTILKAISSGASATEIDKMIQVEADKQRQRLEQQQQMQQQMQAELQKTQMDLMRFQSELRMQEASSKIEAERENKIQDFEIQKTRYAMEADINENKINDKIEAIDREWQHKLPIEKEKLEIERIKAKKTNSK